jgi:hypothetical protein
VSSGLDDINRPSQFIYNAFNSLKLDLNKIQSLAINIAFITPKTFLLFNIDPKMYALICTKLTNLQKLVFVAATLCSPTPILKELDHRPMSRLLKAMYKEVSKNCNTLPNILNKRDHCKEILGGSENLRPMC